MEGECRPRGRDCICVSFGAFATSGALTNPLVVWFVNEFVHAGVVLKTVDPVDGDVVEGHVQQSGDGHPSPAVGAHIVVE